MRSYWRSQQASSAICTIAGTPRKTKGAVKEDLRRWEGQAACTGRRDPAPLPPRRRNRTPACVTIAGARP